MGQLATELIVTNPSRGNELGRVRTTSVEDVARRAELAREAQVSWSRASWPERRKFLRRWHRELCRRADSLASLVRDEVGKPWEEALGSDVLTSLDLVRWTIRSAGTVLAPSRLSPHWQRLMLMPSARLTWKPIGVAGILGAWNYPLLLNAPLIAQALAAGNAVVWKPSELAPLCGQALQESLELAGVPTDLVQIVQGGPDVGRAVAESGVNKLWYTGGVAGGRAVLECLARRGIPSVAELSGFDAAIARRDSPLTRTCAALTWAAFVNAGQACMAVKRIYVVGDARPWAEEIARRAHLLRTGDPATGNVDLGPMISNAARERFHGLVSSAVEAGAKVLAGAEPLPGPGWYYPPTVLLATEERQVAALEGCFGPVVILRGVEHDEDAIRAVNGSAYGLSASVWGKDRREARRIGERLDAGMVGINEAVTFFAHLTAPAGGVKASGYGRVHGPFGLREFVTQSAIVERSTTALRPQGFPYNGVLERCARVYLRLVHGAAGGDRTESR